MTEQLYWIGLWQQVQTHSILILNVCMLMMELHECHDFYSWIQCTKLPRSFELIFIAAVIRLDITLPPQFITLNASPSTSSTIHHTHTHTHTNTPLLHYTSPSIHFIYHIPSIGILVPCTLIPYQYVVPKHTGCSVCVPIDPLKNGDMLP